jgi:hypothetical protein
MGMTRYLVFIENQPVVEGQSTEPLTTAELLTSVGLEDHIGGEVVMGCGHKESPSGQPGKMFGWPKVGDSIIYKPAEQTWLHNKHFGYWIGIWNEKPPTEPDLRRDKTQKGRYIELGPEGQPSNWKIPIAGEVDQRIHFEDDGSVRYVPIRKYAGFVDDVQKIHDSAVDGFYRFSRADEIQMAMKALRINYRITTEVVNHLDLLSVANVSTVFQTVLGLSFKSPDEPA